MIVILAGCFLCGVIGYRMGRTDERLKHDEEYCVRVIDRAIQELSK